MKDMNITNHKSELYEIVFWQCISYICRRRHWHRSQIMMYYPFSSLFLSHSQWSPWLIHAHSISFTNLFKSNDICLFFPFLHYFYDEKYDLLLGVNPTEILIFSSHLKIFFHNFTENNVKILFLFLRLIIDRKLLLSSFTRSDARSDVLYSVRSVDN